jgi:hypothetical protein
MLSPLLRAPGPVEIFLGEVLKLEIFPQIFGQDPFFFFLVLVQGVDFISGMKRPAMSRVPFRSAAYLPVPISDMLVIKRMFFG